MRLSTRLLFLLAVICLVAVLWWYFARSKPVSVRVQAVERGLVEETVANTRAGTVKACRRARLAPSVGGQIATLKAHKGDRVKAGDLLLELWNQDLKAQVTLADREADASDARARAACFNAQNAQREADRQVKLS
ncbi:MAG: biotin/lipoyl-binding protein, partial [Chromatiaceae bacterium]